MRTVTIALLMMIALSGCGILGGGGDDDNNNAASNPERSVVQWDRDPATVVFRADIVGGEQFFYSRSQIPLCTIYGDNHIVWTVTNGTNITQVLHDRLSDQQITQFVEGLTLAYRIYDYTSEAENAISGEIMPVVEQLTLNVNGIEHITDAFGGWDYEYFELIQQNCAELSQSPVIYEPTELWLFVQQVEYDTNSPSLRWDGASRGIDLQALADSGEPAWITNSNVRLLWGIIQDNPPDVQLEQDGSTFQIALGIPNVTISSPPAPDN